MKNKDFKKVIHQFFPIDTNFIIKKFLDYWKPSKAIFIDSEFWPNTIIYLKEKKFPQSLLMEGLQKKLFIDGKFFKFFKQNIFKF